MLTDNQKKLIREEEIFRCEVRTELEKRDAATSMTGSLWGFVNSAFGLWLLSSVMLGLWAFYMDMFRTRGTRGETRKNACPGFDLKLRPTDGNS
jgi:hypothetical protein